MTLTWLQPDDDLALCEFIADNIKYNTEIKMEIKWQYLSYWFDKSASQEDVKETLEYWGRLGYERVDLPSDYTPGIVLLRRSCDAGSGGGE